MSNGAFMGGMVKPVLVRVKPARGRVARREHVDVGGVALDVVGGVAHPGRLLLDDRPVDAGRAGHVARDPADPPAADDHHRPLGPDRRAVGGVEAGDLPRGARHDDPRAGLHRRVGVGDAEGAPLPHADQIDAAALAHVDLADGPPGERPQRRVLARAAS
jgi:hypothetical protein